VAPALRDILDVERELSGAHESVQGSLRITAPHDFGTSDVFAGLLAGFTSRWPGVVPIVELTMRAVDLLEEGFDVAFRARSDWVLPDLEGVMVRRFRRLSGHLYGSPRYLEEHGRPRSPDELRGLRYVAFNLRPDELSLRQPETGEEIRISVDPVVRCNDFSLLCRLLTHDSGVGFVPDFLAKPLVLQGELEPVLPRWLVGGGELDLLWPASRHMSPRVRTFIDFAIEHLTSELAHT
jgi:DNA-binding transcriptional LysR family regulator